MITRAVTDAELKKRYDQEKHHSVKQRILMIIHVKKGKSARQAAEMVMVDKNTVILWCTRFNEQGFGGLKDERRSGKPKKVDYDNLQNALNQSPQAFGYKHQAWHPKLVEIYLLDFQNLKLSKNYAYKLIRKLGFSLKVPRSRSYKSDPKKVLAFKKKMKPIIETVNPEHLTALDECSIQLVTQPKKVIATIGSKPEIRTQMKWGGLTVIAAILGTGRVIYWIQDHATNENCFKKFLRYLKEKTSRGRIHAILDNASFHTRKKVQQLAKRISISLHFQPAHSPFVNAAEHIWKQLREHLRGLLLTSLDELKEVVENFFKTHPILNIQVVKHLV